MSESLPPERPYPLDHEGRIARLEGIIEQIDVRLGRVETKIDSLLRWIIALQVTTWGLIGALKLFG
ncbi:MAG: hypothetical protein F4Z57_23005 [Gemmatimonadetes bacterium]|nr:hypothetical protein [Gemmatimonadota bacterium]MDE2703726.1 hypothetical protein [Gemmatimonadota bacterium]MXW81801.1 hypothetical protein [Gemmatimonadota bacterium]MYA21803.1 hypothetical protein [Gemmatimonadota bacterium]MYC73728.1 hypothetical protein [Gemmatimonadota bacterium]